MRPLILLSFMMFSQLLHADDLASMRKCAELADNLTRLSCYDKLSHRLLKTESVAETPLQRPLTQTVSTQPNKDNLPAVDHSELEATFGIQEEEKGLQQITATIDGEFRGWKKGDVISLSNGQKWKVTSGSKGYTKLNNPEVTIEQGVFDSFNMHIKGFVPFAKVKRIK